MGLRRCKGIQAWFWGVLVVFGSSFTSARARISAISSVPPPPELVEAFMEGVGGGVAVGGGLGVVGLVVKLRILK